MSKISPEWRTVEILALSQVVDKVEDHLHSLHEGQAKDIIDGDVGTCCYQEG